MKKPRLIKDWKASWRWYSQQMMAVSTAVLATWATIPDDLKAGIPDKVVMLSACGLLVLGIIGRLIDQEPWSH